MLRIRLRRTGKKKQASYRVVVADRRAARDGAFVEVIGHYNPRSDPQTLVLEEDRVKYWLEHGAQPSETVHRLLHKEGLIAVAPPQRHTAPSSSEQRESLATEETGQAEEVSTANTDSTDKDAVTEVDSTDEAPTEEAMGERSPEDDQDN